MFMYIRATFNCTPKVIGQLVQFWLYYRFEIREVVWLVSDWFGFDLSFPHSIKNRSYLDIARRPLEKPPGL